jgi:adenylate cyclase
MSELKSEKSFWIEFLGDRSVRVPEGKTLLQASLDAGIPHYHDCGGNANCSTCRVLVHEGSDKLTPPTGAEKRLRKVMNLPDNVRLACQSFAQGSPVKVLRIIRDESDRQFYTEEGKGTQPGIEKDMALFFLDIREFTPFMQSFLPFDVIHILRRMFHLFNTSIEAEQGKIIETAGDGLYAVFGFQQTLEEAAACALRAGRAILDGIREFNDDYLQNYFHHRLDVGIGLHTGRVIMGNVGLGVNNNMTVMGLPVNIASRLQTATRELNNSFVISAEAAELVALENGYKEASVHLKGIQEPVRVFCIGHPYT